MRFWYIHPGYLTNSQLLCEAVYLQELLCPCDNPDPFFDRQTSFINQEFLNIRYLHVKAERKLRAKRYQQPETEIPVRELSSPDLSLGQHPARQFYQLEAILNRTNSSDDFRIPLPSSQQQLWAHHKYSILARNPKSYKTTGRLLSHSDRSESPSMDKLAQMVTENLYLKPDKGNLQNTLEHMWGHVSEFSDHSKPDSPEKLMKQIQYLAISHQAPYILDSTALTDLGLWI